MELHNIVLHHIKREGNQPPELLLSNHLLDSSDKIVIEFVEKLIKSFRSKHPTQGEFQNDTKAYPFQSLVKGLLSKNDFLEFSIESMNLLKKEIQVPQAIGGYVVFTNYTQNGEEYLITIMLDNAVQFSIDDNSLDIKKLKTLDIDKLARANRLNISKWQNNDSLYLAFIKGTRDVSNYFQKFIGNTDLTSSKVNSQNLKSAVSKFMTSVGFTQDQKDDADKKINEYLDKQYKDENDVELQAISAHLDPNNPNKFIEFVEDKELEVSGNFRLFKKSDFYMFHRSKISGSGFKLEFEKALIKQGKILREGNDVVIKELSREMLDEAFDL